MKPEVWQSIRPHLLKITSVDFTGGGEPLLQPHLVKWIRQARSAGCETGILTNGLLLDETTAQTLIEAGIDWLCISMDGATAELYNRIRRGSDFETVCRNIRTLNRFRKGKHPKLMINFVLMKINFHQIKPMVHLADGLGVDQINFKQCDVIRGKHGRGMGLFAARLDRKTKQLAKKLHKARKLAEKRRIGTTAFAFTPKEMPVCDQAPPSAMFVRYDGMVAPCINLAFGGPTTFLGRSVTMPRIQYGRLPENNLVDIWEGKACRFYRQLFEPRTAAYEKVYVDGMLRAVSNIDRLHRNAIEAMPKAPNGCDVCHYLYDI